MLEKEEILLNQIAIALCVGAIWWLASSADYYNAVENIDTLIFAWIFTAIVGCFKKV